MIEALLALLAPAWGYIAAALAALVAFLGVQAAARRDGRKQAEAKQKEKDRAEADRLRQRVDDARRRGVQPDDIRYRD